jgi:hypothetical protein
MYWLSGSVGEGFRTPALSTRGQVTTGRHPKPFSLSRRSNSRVPATSRGAALLSGTWCPAVIYGINALAPVVCPRRFVRRVERGGTIPALNRNPGNVTLLQLIRGRQERVRRPGFTWSQRPGKQPGRGGFSETDWRQKAPPRRGSFPSTSPVPSLSRITPAREISASTLGVKNPTPLSRQQRATRS